MIDTDDPAPEAPSGSEPSVPAAAPVDLGWPTWIRRTLIGLALVACLGIMVWAAGQGGGEDGPTYQDSAIVGLFPTDNAQALRQTQIGADLAQGYDGRLTIDGIAIPEEQMIGALDPETADPEVIEEEGIRPNNRNSVYFKPGPGKVIEELQGGTVNIQLTYFREGQPETARTVAWQIRVD